MAITGDRVRLDGCLGTVINHWRDADLARRQDDNGKRMAVRLDTGELILGMKPGDLEIVGEPEKVYAS